MRERSELHRPDPARGGRLGAVVLVVLSIAAVAVTLEAARRDAALGARLERSHAAWSGHVERLGRLNRLALEISAPSNEVFDSDQLEAEVARSQKARVDFMAQVDTARLEIADLRTSAVTAHLEDLDAVRNATTEMIDDVDKVFASYGVGPPPEIVVVDRHMARIGEALDRLRHRAREGQSLDTKRSLSAASSGGRTTFALLGVILVLAIAFLGWAAVRGARPAPGASAPGGTAVLGRWLRPAIPAGLAAAALLIQADAARRQGTLGETLVAMDEAWSQRMARYGRMSQLPLAMSAPSNEVFDSGDLKAERVRSQQARDAFASEMDTARAEASRIRAEASRPVIECLDAVAKATADLVVDIDRTFGSYGVGRPPDIMVTDGHLSHLQGAYALLERRARESQARESRDLLNAAALRRTSIAILLALIAAVVGIAGLMAGRWPRRAAADIETSPAPALAVETPPPAPPGDQPAVPAAEPAADSRNPSSERRAAAMSSVLLAAPDPVVALDRDGLILEWNARAAVSFGRSIEDVLGRPFVDSLLAPAHREPITRAMRLVLEGDDPDPNRRFEVAALDHVGREFPVELAIVLAPSRDGPVFNLFLRDISRRRRVEAALRESEARTRAIIEEAADGIVTLDDAGTIMTANPAAERVFGYRAGELVGRSLPTLVSDLRAGDNGSAAGPAWRVPGSHELVGRRRTGSAFPVELVISEAQDGLHRWTGIVRDLTQSKQAETLRAGQNRFLELLASGTPLDAALSEWVAIVETQLAGAVGMIVMVDRDRTHMRVCASPSLPWDFRNAVEEVEVGAAGCSWGAAVAARTRIIADDTATHPTWARSRQLALYYGLRSCWAEPLLSTSGQAIGAFAVFRRRVSTPDAAELELVGSAARMASLAVEHALAQPRPTGDGDDMDGEAPVDLLKLG